MNRYRGTQAEFQFSIVAPHTAHSKLLISRAPRRTAAARPLPHAAPLCGYKLANDGIDTRAIQDWLGHVSITHTTRYTQLSPARFKDFWRD